MPKKKLTKAQGQKKMRAMERNMYDLFLDKLAYGADSFSPFSRNKMDELHRTVQMADRKLRRR